MVENSQIVDQNVGYFRKLVREKFKKIFCKDTDLSSLIKMEHFPLFTNGSELVLSFIAWKNQI